MTLTERASFSHWTAEIARYGDTDRQGHINNAIFATFLESGRVDLLFDPEKPLAPDGCSFVIVRLLIEFRAEMHWRGPVEIGTAVLGIGRSSFRVGQGIFQDGQCTATGESVLVLMDDNTRRSTPLPEQTRARLQEMIAPDRISPR
ncbi:MAG: acyl-CoA thioesterase [Acetobacteraceae bacterium]|nr:acyl-CoA thioesterase [Acetobacteraceae bacterium]MBV8521876.1 acyl-CoA thioesterase [Acetobacteraceae bacterium]